MNDADMLTAFKIERAYAEAAEQMRQAMVLLDKAAETLEAAHSHRELRVSDRYDQDMIQGFRDAVYPQIRDASSLVYRQSGNVRQVGTRLRDHLQDRFMDEHEREPDFDERVAAIRAQVFKSA